MIVERWRCPAAPAASAHQATGRPCASPPVASPACRWRASAQHRQRSRRAPYPQSPVEAGERLVHQQHAGAARWRGQRDRCCRRPTAHAGSPGIGTRPTRQRPSVSLRLRLPHGSARHSPNRQMRKQRVSWNIRPTPRFPAAGNARTGDLALVDQHSAGVCRSTPAAIRSKVVLPQPEWPSRHRTHPPDVRRPSAPPHPIGMAHCSARRGWFPPFRAPPGLPRGGSGFSLVVCLLAAGRQVEQFIPRSDPPRAKPAESFGTGTVNPAGTALPAAPFPQFPGRSRYAEASMKCPEMRRWFRR